MQFEADLEERNLKRSPTKMLLKAPAPPPTPPPLLGLVEIPGAIGPVQLGDLAALWNRGVQPIMSQYDKDNLQVG